MSMMKWGDYVRYHPVHEGAASDLSRREARVVFENFMRERSSRLAGLHELLAANISDFHPDVHGLDRLDEWFRRHVQVRTDVAYELTEDWASVASDVGLLLGEIMIQRNPHLYWTLCTSGVRNISYHQPVIMGFKSVPYPRYEIDPRRVVRGYGVSVAKRRVEQEASLFPRMIEDADNSA